MIREIKGYFWGENDSPVKKDDHAMDELRYYVCSLFDEQRKTPFSAVQKDKEKLAKRLKYGERQIR